jgi:beta-glucosidase
VVLAMGCGPLCGGKLDVTRVLQNAEGKDWTTLSVPLACLRAAGADLANVSTPFALTTSGALTLSLSALKLTRASDAVPCAALPPVTAATVVTARSPKVSGEPAKKKKSKAVHGKKKRAAPAHHARSHRHRR